jgi:hypothetical protein
MGSNNLTVEQAQILERLTAFVQSTTTERPNVVAVTGQRGMGKTTLLSALEEKTKGMSTADVRWLGIIDAATIRDDFGLTPEVIELLYRKAPKPASGGHRNDIDDEPSEPLKKTYEHCLRSALKQEDSHRALARDLAMSPSHFGELVLHAARERRELRTAFQNYIKAMATTYERYGSWSRGMPLHLIVCIDDMDLASPELLQRFARGLIDDYGWLDGDKDGRAGNQGYLNNVRLFWIFAFDRKRMIAQLSPLRRAIEANPDLDVGRSLLDKLVPFHRAFDLPGWEHDERRAFISRTVPFYLRINANESTRLQLDELFLRTGHPEMVTALPAQPRALEGIYRWLGEHPASSTNAPPLAAKDMLCAIAMASGEYAFAHAVKSWSAERFANLMEWAPDLELNDTAWAGVAASCIASTPLWGLPLPVTLRDELGGPEAQAFLEALLDILLERNALTPYQLLQRMPFARIELIRSRTKSEFATRDVDAFFRDPTAATAAAVHWHTWKSAGKLWSLEIGPAELWQTIENLRSPVPADLLEARSRSRKEVDDALVNLVKGAATCEPLPKRSRGLIWLVAGLVRVPWHEVEALPSLWDPLTWTRIVAAMLLSAYAWAIWGDRGGTDLPLLHIAVKRSAAALATRDRDAIRGDYAEFIDKLGAWCKVGIEHAEPRNRIGNGANGHDAPSKTRETPATVARTELLRALKSLLAHPAIHKLIDRTKTSKSDSEPPPPRSERPPASQSLLS